MCKNLCANYYFKDGKVRTIDFAKKFAKGPLLFLCILFYSGLCVGLGLNKQGRGIPSPGRPNQINCQNYLKFETVN